MKVQNPIIGRARGSAGGMTFCKNYDKNVARAKAFEVSNPNTQAQQTQRNFFKQLTALSADFSDDQLRFLFPSKPKTMSRRNALSKQIAQSYAIDGTEKTIDFADIDTLGNAPVMDFGITTIGKSSLYISVTLDEKVLTNPEIMECDFVAVLINETKKQMVLPLVYSSVEDDEYSMKYPSGWEQADTIHAIPLITNSKNGAIASVGFGTLSVTKRPARKND